MKRIGFLICIVLVYSFKSVNANEGIAVVDKMEKKLVFYYNNPIDAHDTVFNFKYKASTESCKKVYDIAL